MAVHTLSLWLLFLLLLALPLYFLLKRKLEVKKQNHLLPPGPPKFPFIGNLHQFGELPHQSMWQLSEKYGPVMLLQLGRMRAVIISSAEAAKEVLKVNDLACSSRPNFAATGRLSYNYLDVAFTPYGDYWREIRKIVVLELLSLKRVQSFHFIREEEVDSLINSISLSSSSAVPVNLTKMIYDLTANITLRMSFGFSHRGTNNFDREGFHEVVHEADELLANLSADEYLPCLGWIIDRMNGHHARMERAFLRLDTFFQRVIDDHLKPGREEAHEDVIDVLLRIEKEQAGSGTQFTKDNIKAVLMNLFLAGVDTSAVVVNWAMAELVRNPRLMKKAQEEIRKCVGKKGKVTHCEIDQLYYLNMVIKETLRLHPPGPLLLPRKTMSHCRINGYDIPPNTLIHINAWVIGRDPRYWKDPLEFIPERFANSSVDFKGQSFEFLPFGGGRRICPGVHVATATMQIALANLLYCFDWKPPSGMKEEDIRMEERTGFSLTVARREDLILVPVKHLE
uniref:Cytochrome P450 n=1 Tax=Rhizophora mucronata TaxID=61149 RepID=A0A2P2MX68_RHIMU